ncbi:glucosaminidase domain-containing protein [Pontibacterium granulatum]|uniref:glucosaminidase domain-containing protein n=1 Tax=Pontibacterium granulatum TaxID=2036029 RepID=UPI00249C0748|nr:glucosaminidase domain-containing protein [Pontibacterium granulatum]MDI3322993.1 glucosaminidase domain-containing protein [Pontibacterium granulatum]
MYLSVRVTIATLVVLLLLTLSLTQLSPSKDKTSASQAALKITYKPIHSPDDIEALTPPLIKPVAYTRVSTLATLEAGTKKQKFFDMILPAVLISKQRLEDKRGRLAKIETMATRDTDSELWLQQQFKRYKAKDINQLKVKLADHPTSIILAQAALETGWGTSRFFLEGNNIFGIWSFNPREPRMRASQTREGKPIYVKRYGSLIEAVDDYFVIIARGGPYREFREARIQTNDPLELIKHLHYYSEIGDEYISRLRSLINRNKMIRFDSYQLQTADAI